MAPRTAARTQSARPPEVRSSVPTPAIVVPPAPARSAGAESAAVRPGPFARRPSVEEPAIAGPATDRYQPAPAVRSARPPELRNYAVQTGIERGPLVVFLHGAGQEPKNGVLDRLAAGMQAENVSASFVSLPHERDPESVERLLRNVNRPVILAGHSAGGAEALYLARRYPNKVRAVIGINAVGSAQGMPVPALMLRGTNDGFHPQGETDQHVRVVLVAGSDHSLRFNSSWDRAAKEAAEGTPETAEMNRGVARTVREFLATLPPE